MRQSSAPRSAPTLAGVPAGEVFARAALAQLPPGRAGALRLRRTGGRIRIAGEDVELRWGPDGRWYLHRKERGQWWAAGTPHPDAAEALRGAVGSECTSHYRTRAAGGLGRCLDRPVMMLGTVQGCMARRWTALCTIDSAFLRPLHALKAAAQLFTG
ncbi:hypothetical protein N566_04145 [Streptomycetaceae bacterium MP113-05]|nr:hypothetical protein N566_04145 [Streptomycetaceae bacterium MP113-05]